MNNKEKERLKELLELKEKNKDKGGIDSFSELERIEYMALRAKDLEDNNPEKAREDQRIADQLAKANEKATEGKSTKMRISDPEQRQRLKKLAEKMIDKMGKRKVNRIYGDKMKATSVVLSGLESQMLKDLVDDLIDVSNVKAFNLSNVMTLIIVEYLEAYKKK